MRPLPLPPPARLGATPWRGIAAVFALALGLRAGLVVLAPGLVALVGDYVGRYAVIAHGLLATGGFSIAGGPTAVSGPVYPLFLAAVYALFGDGETAVRLALAVVDAAQCALTFWLARRLFGARVAVLASAASILCPFFIFGIYRGFTEPVFMAFHAGFLVALVAALDRRSAALAALAGALLGLATLTRAVPLLLPLALAVPFAVRYRSRAGALHWGALALAFVAALAPWTARNYAVFGRLVPVQTLGGYHLVGAAAGDDASVPGARLQTVDQDSLSRVAVDASLYATAAQRVASDLPGHLRLTARRLGDMWYRTNTGNGEGVLKLFSGLLLVVAAGGAWAERRRWRALVPLLTVAAYYVAVHSQMLAVFRYMLPVLPVLFVLASVAVVRLWGAVAERRGG